MQPARNGDGAIDELVGALHLSTAELGAFDPRTIAVAHRLAAAFWHVGHVDQAISLLDQALEGLATTGSSHPVRADVLCTLGEILIDQGYWEPASVVLREVHDLCVQRSGPSHPSAIAAKGDLASVLFELGDSAEAARLESEAVEHA